MAMRECPECGVRLEVSERHYGVGWRKVKHCANCLWAQPVGPVYPTAEAARNAKYTLARVETGASRGEWR
jgi:hypothetical protein